MSRGKLRFTDEKQNYIRDQWAKAKKSNDKLTIMDFARRFCTNGNTMGMILKGEYPRKRNG